MAARRRAGSGRRLCGAAALAAALMIPSVVPASAAGPYPVSYRVLPGVIANATDPTGSPPGANNWSCKPSAAHPTPVVLVHGLLATMQDNWNTISPLLADRGYCVFALTYGSEGGNPYFGGLVAMEQSAAELGALVTRVLAATGAARVDLVGHSEGTVMPRYWMEFLGGARFVDRYVMLTPIWHGTQFYGAATIQQLGSELVPGFTLLEAQLFAQTCGSCPEFLTGSPFLRKLDAAGTALAGVTYTDIMTRYDELVIPYTSGNLVAPNVTNIVLQNQCPVDDSDHLTVAFDPTAAQDVLNALDPAHASRVPCVPVIAGFGALYPPS
jgi:triacylglycerol lipase